MNKLTRNILRTAPSVMPESASEWLCKFFSKTAFKGWLTDKFLEALLYGMDLFALLSSGFRKNLEGFNAKYCFVTDTGTVHASAIFNDGNLDVVDKKIDDWDTLITFKDAKALRDFLFSKNQDILNSILKNEVVVQGNLNLIYKFGFLGRDIQRRLGLDKNG